MLDLYTRDSKRGGAWMNPIVSESALRGTRGVTHVEHVTSELARKELLQSGDEVLAALPPEAFPASIEVRVHDPARSGALPRMAEKLRLLPRVEAVETYEIEILPDVVDPPGTSRRRAVRPR